MTATEQLAEYVANLRYEDLPADVVDMAKLSIRDIVSVALFASPLEWTEIAAAMAREAECGPVSSVWGHGWKTSAAYAALVNGTAAHGIEMDDRSHNLEIHNGASTVSAAIAMAERCGKSGKDVILGVVCGYEVAFRVARATRGGIWPRFYSDGIRAFWGAAAAAGKVLGLDPQGMVYTFGITGSMASGLMEDTLDPFGTMVKRLQGGGWQGYSGVTAALLAQQGLTAPRAMIDGEGGFCKSFCTVKEPDLSLLTKDLGQGFEMLHWETKPYATRGAYHGAIDAVREMRTEHGIEVGQIDRLVMGGSSRIMGNANTGKPDSVMAAQYNLPFVISAAFRHDLRNPGIWNEQTLGDPAIWDTWNRSSVEVDPEIDSIYKSTGTNAGIRVTAHLTDGKTVSVWRKHAKGTPSNPMTRADLDAKFSLLASQIIGDEKAARLGELLDRLENAPAPLDLTAITSRQS